MASWLATGDVNAEIKEPIPSSKRFATFWPAVLLVSPDGCSRYGLFGVNRLGLIVLEAQREPLGGSWCMVIAGPCH